MLRGGISGFGEVAAQAHLPGWRDRAGIQIVAAHEPIAERRHQALRLIKNVRVYESLEWMLDGERLDFVDIASPPAHHASAIAMALEAGAHVLVEKPLCLALDEFDRLAAQAAASKRIVMCVHNWKHAPPYRLARQLIDSGRLGAPRYLAIDRLRTEPADGSKWRLDARSGGGILIDHGWHIFYLMQWLMGAAQLSISAHLGGAGNVEEVADLRVIFEGDRVARSHLSWRAPIRRTHAALYGDQAMLEVENDRVTVCDRSGHVEVIPASDSRDDSYHAAWFAGIAAEFESAVTSGPDSQIASSNLAEARAALALTIAARKSHDSGGVAITL